MICQSAFKKGLGVMALLIFSAVFARAEIVYGIAAASSSGTAAATQLWVFDSTNPAGAVLVGNFTGLVATHSVRSIDFRPSNGVLYAVSSPATGNTAAIYTVNRFTAALTQVGPTFTLGAGGSINNDRRLEIEWDPTSDTAKILSAAPGLDDAGSGQVGRSNNFRFNPATNTLTENTKMAYADSNAGFPFSNVVASAYSNNVTTATTTTLFVFDWGAFDTLARLGGANGPPNPDTGQLFGIFTPASPATAGSGVGMDISGNTGIMYVTHDSAATAGADMRFFTKNPATGAETQIGIFPTDVYIADISVSNIPTAAGVTVSGRLSVPGSRAGLVNAMVLLTDSHGVTRTVNSGKGGIFVFEDVEVGQSYTLTVKSRLYNFDPQVVTVNDSISDIFMVGSPIRRPEEETR